MAEGSINESQNLYYFGQKADKAPEIENNNDCIEEAYSYTHNNTRIVIARYTDPCLDIVKGKRKVEQWVVRETIDEAHSKVLAYSNSKWVKLWI